MNFVWAGERNKYNSRLKFSLNNRKGADKLIICAVDFYQIFLDDKFVSYGPERTAAGYVRAREIKIVGVKKIDIYVTGYNFTCYACDFQQPFFAAELYKNDILLYNSNDFQCISDKGRKTEVSRFSGQRGCVEFYDFTNKEEVALQIYDVERANIIKGIGDFADYNNISLDKIAQGNFTGFDEIKYPEWCDREKYKLHIEDFDVQQDFLNKIDNTYKYVDYCLNEEHSGFLSFDIISEDCSELFFVFEEITIDGKWCFRRSGCNEVICLKVGKGRFKYISSEPYSLKMLKLITKDNVTVMPSIITFENKNAYKVKIEGDERVVKVFEAARNTFKQNALDIFMDCPSRERAGWLFDSFLLGQSERFFTGENNIEKNYLENYLIANPPALPPKMVPKCFPSSHPTGHYVPTWAMWFIIEVYYYYKRTRDDEFIAKSKEKIYNIISFFDDYLNSDGLLEDLEGWVFIEWSACNDVDHIKGVNYPANMLFAYAIKLVGEIFGDSTLLNRATKMQAEIYSQAFNGNFFIDNSIRINGNLIRQDKHLTETCQYYALYTGICPSETFRQKMIKDFGPNRTDKYLNIEKSNMIVGNCLRFIWLSEEGEYNRVIEECVNHFYPMAIKTGTLWEHNSPMASCNHGFASIAGVLLAKCLTGYETVNNKKPVLKFKNENYNINFEFNY